MLRSLVIVLDNVELLLFIAKKLTNCSVDDNGELPIKFFKFLGGLKNAEV